MGNNFRRKERFVADGNKNNTPAEMTYLLVVSRDSVWISLTIVALNDLDVLAFNIYNACLTVYCREQVWLVAGPKFVSEAENEMLVRNALYGLKDYGAAFRSFLAETMDAIVFRPSYTDP